MQTPHFQLGKGLPAVFRGRAFTLIELLVTILIIALLISILLPAISRARAAAFQAKEMSAGKQLMTAYLMYSSDNKGVLMPGYIKSSWTDGTNPNHQFRVWESPLHKGPEEQMLGTVIRRYPYRLLPYLDYNLDGLIIDPRLNSEYRRLPDDRNGRLSFQRGFSTSPSFGLNTTYIGGDSKRGAFFVPSIRRWGPYYVTRVDAVSDGAKLMVFSTARGGHTDPANHAVVPGRHRIEGPWQASTTSNSLPVFLRWTVPVGAFRPSHSPGTYGHLDFRHGGSAISVMFDGHVELLKLDELSDMRRWSNKATSANWRPR